MRACVCVCECAFTFDGTRPNQALDVASEKQFKEVIWQSKHHIRTSKFVHYKCASYENLKKTGVMNVKNCSIEMQLSGGRAPVGQACSIHLRNEYCGVRSTKSAVQFTRQILQCRIYVEMRIT